MKKQTTTLLLCLAVMVIALAGCNKIDMTDTSTSIPDTTSTKTKVTTIVTTTEVVTSEQQPLQTETPLEIPLIETTIVPVATTTIQESVVGKHMVNTSTYATLNFSEQKAMWISFLEFQNILKGKSKTQFTASVKKMYDNCKKMGVNTVYVHARSHSDAYYVSDLYPWSVNVSGVIGTAPNFDPFEILVKEAHDRGLSIHAWVNPMRGLTEKEIDTISNKYIMKQWYNDSAKKGKYMVLVNGVWYLSPAYKDVRNYITDGVIEIVSRYNVDGIHIDDYFYPTIDKSFDKSAFSASGASNLSNWRLETVSSMVRDMYSGVKSVNPNVLFGVSPQGNVKNNYETQFADVKKWASEPGYLDYLVPQVYFGFNNKTQPYEKNVQSWCDMVKAPHVQLVIGLAPYKIGTQEGTKEWERDKSIMARQVESFRQQKKYGGVAFFRYESLYSPAKNVSAKVNAELNDLVSILSDTLSGLPPLAS